MPTSTTSDLSTPSTTVSEIPEYWGLVPTVSLFLVQLKVYFVSDVLCAIAKICYQYICIAVHINVICTHRTSMAQCLQSIPVGRGLSLRGKALDKFFLV